MADRQRVEADWPLLVARIDQDDIVGALIGDPS
jgi:hypothetical protein